VTHGGWRLMTSFRFGDEIDVARLLLQHALALVHFSQLACFLEIQLLQCCDFGSCLTKPS